MIGADGVSDMFAKARSLGDTGLGLARQLMDAMKPTETPHPKGNGSVSIDTTRTATEIKRQD